MRFEVGKYYRHTTGREIHIVGRVEGLVYWMGPTLVSERLGDGQPAFIGEDEDAAQNWTECEPWVIDEARASVHSAEAPLE